MPIQLKVRTPRTVLCAAAGAPELPPAPPPPLQQVPAERLQTQGVPCILILPTPRGPNALASCRCQATLGGQPRRTSMSGQR